MATNYYPEYLRFAGEKYSLSQQDWDDYYRIMSKQSRKNRGIPVELHCAMTREFLQARGYIRGNH